MTGLGHKLIKGIIDGAKGRYSHWGRRGGASCISNEEDQPELAVTPLLQARPRRVTVDARPVSCGIRGVGRKDLPTLACNIMKICV